MVSSKMNATDRLLDIDQYLRVSGNFSHQGCIGLFYSLSKCTDFPSLSTPLVPRMRPFQCLTGEAVAFGIPISNQGFPGFLKRLICILGGLFRSFRIAAQRRIWHERSVRTFCV